MEDWWLWSSDDLVNWELEYTLEPEETYIGKPFDQCWATDFIKRNGKYYWYFSEGNRQTGVMVGDSPSGPWKDPLGKPLLTEEMTTTDEYDMGIVQDEQGEYYIVFGVWDFYIARLNEDMISLAETPRKIEIINPRGPYNLDGKNIEKPTDDKPFIHFYNGKFYLSWGCFYAMSDHIYGPYDYMGSIIEQESFAPGFDSPTWPTGFKQGRHGSFFEWHGQWYFAYCDISQTGNRYFRDTFISYVYYRENGEIAIIRIDGTGVGEYDANSLPIEAEDFFKASGIKKKEKQTGGFILTDISDNDFLIFPNIAGLESKSGIELNLEAMKQLTIEIRKDNPTGELLASTELFPARTVSALFMDIPNLSTIANICFVFRGSGENLLDFDSFSFK